MRLPRESLLFLGLATATCLLGGVVFGIATGQFLTPSAPRASATPPPTASSFAAASNPTASPPGMAASPSPVGAQKSLLLIGVDDAQAASPQLETVWVVSFQPGVNKYYISAVSPSAEFQLASLSGTRSLRDIFAEDQRQQIGYYFMRDAVEARFPGFTIDADVVLDRDDFVGLIASLGGLNWTGQLVAGSDVLHQYDTLAPDDSASRMLFQQQVFETLYAALAAHGTTTDDLMAYIRQLPQVQADAGRLAALDAFVSGAPAIADSALFWHTFQPEMEISAQP